MRRYRLVGIVVAVLIATALLIHCSEKDKGTNPGPKTVEIRGTVSFPTGTPITMSDLVVGFADTDNEIDSAGAVTIKGTEHIPGIAMVADFDSTVSLMSIIPDPQANQLVRLDARSTAIALVFMNPFICSSKRDMAVAAYNDIDALPQVDTLETVLTQKLAADPQYLEKDDAQIETALSHAVVAYVQSHVATGSSISASDNGRLRKPAGGSGAASQIIVSPTTPKSGHLVTYVGNDVFKITNAYGRWAVCIVPNSAEKLWLPPNGSMLDFFYHGLPWAPSERTFTLHVANPDDTLKVYVYGWGMKSDAESRYELLTAEEKQLCDAAGFYTFLSEFLTNVVEMVTSVHSGLSGIDGWEHEAEASESDMWMIEFMFSDIEFMTKVRDLVKEGEYGEAGWVVFRKVVGRITTVESYRLKFEALMKLSLSKKHLYHLRWLASQPATYAIGEGVVVGEKLTNVLKTAYGLRDAYPKTTFSIWKSNEDFGGITGHVMQKESPFGPIAGAHVHLSGDDNNPIPGHVTDVTTDADGGFAFANVMAGAKSLTATKAGYNDKSVSVTVAKNQVADVTIEMSKRVGTIKGIVVNEIYSKARKVADELPQFANQDTLFDSQLYIYARGQVAGQSYEDSRTISNGRYTFDLPAGTFWIVAIHPDNDYAPDSMQVTTVENEIHDAPRALLMKALGSMSVEFYVDASSSPQTYTYSVTGASWWDTSHGLSEIALIGGIKDQQYVGLGINMRRVTSPNYYPLGPEYNYDQATYGYGGFAEYASTLLKCHSPSGDDNILFMVPGKPDAKPCDCGITDFGTLYITHFGSQLGDILEGSFDCHLAGYKTCTCEKNAAHPDQWDVVCQTLYFKDVKFRMVVGSLLATELPLGSAALITPKSITDIVSPLSRLPSR